MEIGGVHVNISLVYSDFSQLLFINYNLKDKYNTSLHLKVIFQLVIDCNKIITSPLDDVVIVPL